MQQIPNKKKAEKNDSLALKEFETTATTRAPIGIKHIVVSIEDMDLDIAQIQINSKLGEESG